jgi:hypothetical protein
MKKNKGKAVDDKIEGLLRDLLITTLATAGVNGGNIRRIIGCGMNNVTRIVKYLPEVKK